LFAILFTSVISGGVAARSGVAIADAAVPVSPPTSRLPYVGDLDGRYLWLGITGAATHDDGAWDTVFGAEASIVRVREDAGLALVGGGLAGARVAKGGWRLSLDAAVGTRVLGRFVGATLGPTLDLEELAHPVAGASATAWMFLGITPYVRIGVLADGTRYIDLGAQVGLPIARF
jgi:hypothetical protein